MLVHPQFDPIAVSVGPIAVRWYGLMYLAGFVLFVVLGRWRARQPMYAGWKPTDIDDMLFYKPLYYLAHPLEIFEVWHGGMSFHGGFLGVLLALVFFARRRGRALLDVTDFVAP